jgi:acetoacetate decarboxylase
MASIAAGLEPYSIPHVAPLYPPVPYHYQGVRKLSVFCRANPDAIREAVPYPLDPASDVIELYVQDAARADPLAGYAEGGVIIPAQFEDQLGGHFAYEFVSSDSSLAAGREIWGYPKKMGTIGFEEDGEHVHASVSRGNALIVLDFEPDEDVQFSPPTLRPRLLVKCFVRGDGTRRDLYHVIRVGSQDFTQNELRTGRGTVRLTGSGEDPLDRFMPLEVVGAQFGVYDFVLPYGDILKELPV